MGRRHGTVGEGGHSSIWVVDAVVDPALRFKHDTIRVFLLDDDLL